MNARIRLIFIFAMILWAAPHSFASGAQKDLRWDEELKRIPQSKSRDLQADIRKMWRAVPLPGENFYASPVSAINAAERVFNTIDFTGLTREAVIQQTHATLCSPKYGYCAPFWPVPKDAEVFRFDCGNFGWQFTLILGRDDKVKKITKQWIH